MKKIYFYITVILLSFLSLGIITHAQSCEAISLEVFPANPQSGPHNYFGIRVSLSQAYNEDVTVTGYIWDVGNAPEYTHPYSLTIPAYSLSAETSVFFYETDPTADAQASITSVSPCPNTNNDITVTYAGVTITYEINNNILRFNSINDINAVLDQLDADYDNYNDNYDNSYDPNLTDDQMDSVDATNNFDEFQKFKDFESLFSGFSSKRAEIENTETTWVNTSFESTNPDDIDLTFDDAANAIFNSDYSFKIGNDVYQLTTDGMYINGTLQSFLDKNLQYDDGSVASNRTYSNALLYDEVGNNMAEATLIKGGPSFINEPFQDDNNNAENGWTICKSNKKKTAYDDYGNERYALKVAIHSWFIRSGATGKVVHFKAKNGTWKKSRAKNGRFYWWQYL